MLKDESIIKFGFAIVIAGIIIVYFGFWLSGEIHNTYHLKLGDDLIELIKWIIGAVGGLSAASGVTTAIVALRKNGEPIEPAVITEDKK